MHVYCIAFFTLVQQETWFALNWAIPAYIMVRAWQLSDKKPMGFLSDNSHVRAVMHVGIAN